VKWLESAFLWVNWYLVLRAPWPPPGVATPNEKHARKLCVLLRNLKPSSDSDSKTVVSLDYETRNRCKGPRKTRFSITLEPLSLFVMMTNADFLLTEAAA
jgi:hypothetical protein